jgi:hypothetical protein
VTKYMSANPSGIVRLWNEFKERSPDKADLVLGGIYAAKSGYHNTRANHVNDVNGGSPSDYSVQLTTDKRGPSDKAAALDITFNTARRSDFRVIAKYSKRLYTAMVNRDPRLFYQGKAVVREFFGNTDLDRVVEGYSLYRARPASSDTSHLWHIHISFHREFVENYEALKGVLAILLGEPLVKPDPVKPPTEDSETVTPQEIEAVAARAADLVWFERLTNPRSPAGTVAPHASTYLVAMANKVDDLTASVGLLDTQLKSALAKLDELINRGNE